MEGLQIVPYMGSPSIAWVADGTNRTLHIGTVVKGLEGYLYEHEMVIGTSLAMVGNRRTLA